MSADMVFTAEDVTRFCCIDLMRAEVRKQVSTASGGVWIGSQEHGGCSSLPVARFCPFCGSRIVSVRHDGGGWSWHTETVYRQPEGGKSA